MREDHFTNEEDKNKEGRKEGRKKGRKEGRKARQVARWRGRRERKGKRKEGGTVSSEFRFDSCSFLVSSFANRVSGRRREMLPNS